jgi:hypothetical protein
MSKAYKSGSPAQAQREPSKPAWVRVPKWHGMWVLGYRWRLCDWDRDSTLSPPTKWYHGYMTEVQMAKHLLTLRYDPNLHWHGYADP